MLKLSELKINTYDGESYQIVWDFEPTAETITDYSINIYRAEAPSLNIIEYDIVASGISANDYYYNDYSVIQLLDYGRQWFYKIGIKNNLTDEIDYTPTNPVYLKSEVPDRVFREIVRRKSINLNNTRFSGRTFRVFKRRTWGTHCTECWDEVLQRTTKSNCTTCLGTGWLNGFYNAITFKGMKNSSPKLTQVNMYGEWKPSDSLLYLLGNPPLKPKDIIADDNNHLWSVVQVRTIERVGHVIEQIAQMALITQDDLLYKYLLSDSLSNIGGNLIPTTDIYTLHKYYFADTTVGDVLYTLPSVIVWKNRSITIKADNLNGAIVTISTSDLSTIDGNSNFIINTPFGTVTLTSDGVNWRTT